MRDFHFMINGVDVTLSLGRVKISRLLRNLYDLERVDVHSSIK